MADEGFFETLLGEFLDGLHHWHTGKPDGDERLICTIKAPQVLQSGKSSIFCLKNMHPPIAGDPDSHLGSAAS